MTTAVANCVEELDRVLTNPMLGLYDQIRRVFRSDKPVLVCFSSGHTDLYRNGVLESLGMPTGSDRWFRYTINKSVGRTVRNSIDTGLLEGAEVLICYLDQSVKGSRPVPIPCRFARVVRVETDDPKIYVLLRYQEFAYAEDLSQFASDLDDKAALKKGKDATSSESLPDWPRDGDAVEPHGLYFFQLSASPKTVARVHSLVDWVKIATQLSGHQDFADTRTFFRLEGLFDRSNKMVRLRNGECRIGGGTMYRVRIYYFAPRFVPATPTATQIGQDIEVTANARIGSEQIDIHGKAHLAPGVGPQVVKAVKLSSQSDRITFIDPPIVAIAARIDREEVRIVTSPAWWGDETTIVLGRLGAGEDEAPHFVLPVRVRVDFWGTVFLVLAVTATVAMGPLAAVLTKDTFSWAKHGLLVGGIAAVSFVGGVLAVTKLRKLG